MKQWLAAAMVFSAGCFATEVGNPSADPDLDLGGVTVKPPDMVLNPNDAMFEFGPEALVGDVVEVWIWNLSRGGPAIVAPVQADGTVSAHVSEAYSPSTTTTYFGLELRSSEGFERFFFASLVAGTGLGDGMSCFREEAVEEGPNELESGCAADVSLSFAALDSSTVTPMDLTLSPETPALVEIETEGPDVLLASDGTGLVGAIRVQSVD